MDINNYINNQLIEKEGIWYGPEGGYWSNLEKSKSQVYLNDLKTLGSEKTMKKYFPQHEDVLSPKRAGGVATLELAENETILDAGCMWGALSMPLARTGATVVALDQTKESLVFLARRKEEEKAENLHLVCSDLKKTDFRDGAFDKVVVNGVLEWVPETTEVEVSKFVSKENSLKENVKNLFKKQSDEKSPKDIQLEFLKKVNKTLKDNGTLYLAIENRYDLLYFFGVPEPHCGIKFISLLPRKLQDFLSLMLRGRKFRSWTYSRRELDGLLRLAGFNDITFYYAFPDYKEPEQVLTDEGMGLLRRYKSLGDKPFLKKVILRFIEEFIYKRFKWTSLAPSFIVHAGK
ncbi:MAG: class I SAM-dependent methyltransferase [Candidatus Omnitrophota bacterium]